MFKLFSDIYFVVYKLYYVGQNNNLDIRVSLMNWDRGSTNHRSPRAKRIANYALKTGMKGVFARAIDYLFLPVQRTGTFASLY
jgi:hypothetical protein